MKKTFDFSRDDTKYKLINTNPNEKRPPFVIEKGTLEFNSEIFYDYVFSDITGEFDIEINNLIQNGTVPDLEVKEAKRVYDVIVQICTGVIEEMKKKHIR